MKKSIILLLAVFTVTSTLTFAHRGRTDSKGCHTNRKNWGISLPQKNRNKSGI